MFLGQGRPLSRIFPGRDGTGGRDPIGIYLGTVRGPFARHPVSSTIQGERCQHPGIRDELRRIGVFGETARFRRGPGITFRFRLRFCNDALKCGNSLSLYSAVDSVGKPPHSIGPSAEPGSHFPAYSLNPSPVDPGEVDLGLFGKLFRDLVGEKLIAIGLLAEVILGLRGLAREGTVGDPPS